MDLSVAADRLGCDHFPPELAQWWTEQDGVEPSPLSRSDRVFGPGWPVSLDLSAEKSEEISHEFLQGIGFGPTIPVLVATDNHGWTFVDCGGPEPGTVWQFSEHGIGTIYPSLRQLVRDASRLLETGWTWFDADGTFQAANLRLSPRLPWPDPDTPRVMLGGGSHSRVGPAPSSS